MGWRDLLGLRPRIEDFAGLLIRRASNDRSGATWTYDHSEKSLRSSGGAQINLVNIHLEYANASRARRGELLDKYLSMLTSSDREPPKLWSLAAEGIILAVRSKYDFMVPSIAGRAKPTSLNKGVTWPFVGDLCLRLLYDFGPSMAHVGEELLATWGQDEGAVRNQALKNLNSLQRPVWSPLEGGVYKLVSEVAYEESFLLIDGVVNQLSFAQSAVFMPLSRGVLLAADGRSEESLSAMLQTAFSALQNNPWPMSGTMLTRDNGHWSEFKTKGLTAQRARAVAALNLASIYKDQQEVLEKHFEKIGEDIFVATFNLRQRGDDIAGIYSWSVWTEGVLTLLPRTDVVIFGRGAEAARESLIVKWE
jgi:hypothetical protein